MSDSNQMVRDAVAAFLERRGISPTRLGRLIFGNPSFVNVLMRGRGLRLDSADRILEFIGCEAIGPRFRREVEAYLAVTGAKASALGEAALGNRSFVGRLRRGSSPRLSTVDRLRAWMARNASDEERRMIEAAVSGGLNSDRGGSGGEGREAEDEPAADAGIQSRYVTAAELAADLKVSRRTLDRWRVAGGGPNYYKLRGRILYARTEVEAWLAGRRRRSTSDAGDGDPEDA